MAWRGLEAGDVKGLSERRVVKRELQSSLVER
jgi:hypothetical protein